MFFVSEPLSLREFRKLLVYLNDRTKSITIKGFVGSPGNSKKESVSPSIMQNICEKCPNLTEFSLEECFIDASKTPLNIFPKSLTKLSLKNSEVFNIAERTNYFSGLHLHMEGNENFHYENQYIN